MNLCTYYDKISRDVALLQCARNDTRKKRLVDHNLATNLTASSTAIVSGLFPAPRVNPSPVSIRSSSLSNFDDDAMFPTVVIPSRALPQNRSTFRPVIAKAAAEKTSTRKPFHCGSSVYFDQLMQETFGPYGSAYTKIPVDLYVLQELYDLRTSLDQTSDIACINRWIRLLAESIDLPPSRFGIHYSFFDEQENEQSILHRLHSAS